MNHGDTGGNRVRCGGETTVAAIDQHPTAVGPVLPAKNFQQGRFARPVLAQQTMDGTGMRFEAHAFERFHAGERLGHLIELKSCGHHIPIFARTSA